MYPRKSQLQELEGYGRYSGMDIGIMQRPGKFFLIDDQKVVMMSLQISAIEHCCSEVAELILCDYGNCGTSMIT